MALIRLRTVSPGSVAVLRTYYNVFEKLWICQSSELIFALLGFSTSEILEMSLTSTFEHYQVLKIYIPNRKPTIAV